MDTNTLQSLISLLLKVLSNTDINPSNEWLNPNKNLYEEKE